MLQAQGLASKRPQGQGKQKANEQEARVAEVAAAKEEKQEMKPEKKAAAGPCRRKHGFYSKFKERAVGRER